jgi:hypothetical protein
MPLDVAKRLSLWAAAHPRSEAAGFVIEAAEEIERLKKDLDASIKETSAWARLSGYYEGTLEVIASGYLHPTDARSVAKSAVSLMEEYSNAKG